MSKLSLHFFGCGTASYAVARALAEAEKPPQSITFIDKAVIRENNAITCQLYAGRTGEPKADRLAGLMRQWLPGTGVRSIVDCVENAAWWEILQEDAADPDAMPLAVIGLDDWDSRMTVIEDLRQLATILPRSPRIPAVQVALERDQAQVCVFGSDWADPCPACGLLSLPAPQPCVLFDGSGQLVRGNLRREADAAAGLAVRIVSHLVKRVGQNANRWLNTKTNLIATPGGLEFRTATRSTTRMAGCIGPHVAHCGRWQDIWCRSS